MKKLLSQVKNKEYLVLSFILGFICMYIHLLFRGVANGGMYSLISGDMLENYIPAIRNLCRDIINGESTDYTWTMCLGMNTSLYNAYYAYNPFNILYLIFYNSDENLITLIMICIKTGLASASFYIWMSKARNNETAWTIVFALFYSMCAFQVSYNVMNIIWLDAMFILPLVFAGVLSLYKEGSWLGLSFCYAYIFTFQFYMGYIIGVASLLYFIFLVVIGKRAKDFRVILKYCVSVIMAIGVSAVVWLPALCFLLNNNPSDASEYAGISTTIPQIFKAFFWREITGNYSDYPNLYSGIPTVLLVPLFFISKKVDKREKMIYGGLLLLLLLSCKNDFLYLVWHGFDAPNGWGCRFAYIISFLMCTIAVKSLSEERVNGLLILAMSIVELVIYVIANYVTREAVLSLKILGNSLFMAAWIIVIILYFRYKDKNMNYLKYVYILLAAIECTTAFIALENLEPELGKIDFEQWRESEGRILDTLNDDNSFYRVSPLLDFGLSTGTYWGFNSMSYFSTAENPVVRRALANYGVYNTPRMMLCFGLTPITNMLFDVKYNTYGIGLENGGADELKTSVVKNDNVLGLGYMVGGEAEDYNITGENVFENNNRLLSKMIGDEIEAFKKIEDERVVKEEYGIGFQKSDNGYLIIKDNNGEYENAFLRFIVNNRKDRLAYTYIINEQSIKSEYSFLMSGGYENTFHRLGNTTVSYIKPMIPSGDVSILEIFPIGDVYAQNLKDILFYEYCQEACASVYNKLSEHQMEILQLNDGYIRGKVKTDGKNKILFTSIPYDKGWSVKINGEDAEISPILNDAFVSVIIADSGEHDVEFTFVPVGKRLGMLLSCLFLVAYIVLILLSKYGIREIKECTD